MTEEDRSIKCGRSGPVLVRGLIRRVWRPRYLELDDEGVLRYYEASSTDASISFELKNGEKSSNPYVASKEYVNVTNDNESLSSEMQAFSLPVLPDSKSQSDLVHVTKTVLDRRKKNGLVDWNGSNSGPIISLSDQSNDRQQKTGTDDKVSFFGSDDDEDGKGSNTSQSEEESNLQKSRINDGGDGGNQERTKSLPSPGCIGVENVMPPDETFTLKRAETLHHRIHEHRPKATMTILSARLIDTTALRDIHVGLPKDKFGFIFCGRQIFSDDDYGFESIQEDSCEIRDDICHPLSILSSNQDYFDTSRDYLCAVETKEEAEKWVTELQHAVSFGFEKMDGDKEYDDSSVGNENYEVDEESYYKTLLKSTKPVQKEDNDIGIVEDLVFEDESETSQYSNENDEDTGESPGEEIVIVTKVNDFAVKRINHKRILGLNVEVMYEVQILLLRKNHLKNRSRRRKFSPSTDDNDKSWSVEERTLFRRKSDFIPFVKTMIRSCHSESEGTDDNKTITQIGDELNGSITKLSQLTVEGYTKSNLSNSVLLVDKILRTLATDSRLCNFPIVKDFLDLTKDDSSFIDDLGFQPKTRLLDIQIGNSTDAFVKQWLFGSSKKVKGWKALLETELFLILSRPVGETLVTGFLALIVYYIFGFWRFYLCRSLHVRFDMLIIMLFCSLFCGFNIGAVSSGTTKHDSEDIKLSSRSDSSMKKRKKPDGVRKRRIIKARSNASSKKDRNLRDTNGYPSLSSPLPQYPDNNCCSCWSKPISNIFRVRGRHYLHDRVKIPSAKAPFKCRGVDVWLTDNPERNIARHPSMLGGKLGDEDTFVVNFLLPFANFVSYFSIPPIKDMPLNVASVWTKFIRGDQQYRDARLKLLPIVIEGPWIVKKAVGPGTAPALLGQAIPLQYYFNQPDGDKKGVYEVDVIITASKIAKGILSVVKSHTKRLTIAFAFIIEAASESELPETVLCCFQLHALHLENCPELPKYFLDAPGES